MSNTTASGAFQVFGQDVDQAFVINAYSMSAITFTLMFLFELILWRDPVWQAKFKLKINRDLYMTAVRSNLTHYLILGPIAYGVVYAYVASRGSYTRWFSIPGVLATQALGYATGHHWMHKTSNYWIHKFHHQFNEKTFVRPIAANTVTIYEFLIAYVSPIVIGIAIFRPDKDAMFWVTSAISVTNLLIHTPETILPQRWVPGWMVSNWKHFHHHEKDVRSYYSAPIFDVDGLLGLNKKKRKVATD